ncbi:RNA polymerase sigma-70 factor (ECF subfamily) [Archangium gephyra]|uniref:RNA polymerase sigma-70 factor (ECF subfamily) n=1 Tax=Archangium gephyra TaxID=48 RepID=A0ABX9JP73_9BACT|nr:sigma-70 family RNA polymerase sigma factor [Archangium gephyra]REG23566.1 RNA polymerase sigma-70 factor (ECF subfamily) [Archangium gephyra]
MGPEQLSALYDKYGYSLHQRCLLLLGNRADAEDAVQDVFVRVRHYHGSLKAPVTLAWLYAIANHVCFDKAKRRAREEPWEPPELAELDPRRQGAPEDADRRALVSSVMGQLDGRMRDIVILHHIEGWTQEEIAAQTGYSRRTVGKKLAGFAELLRERWRKFRELTSPEVKP